MEHPYGVVCHRVTRHAASLRPSERLCEVLALKLLDISDVGTSVCRVRPATEWPR